MDCRMIAIERDWFITVDPQEQEQPVHWERGEGLPLMAVTNGVFTITTITTIITIFKFIIINENTPLSFKALDHFSPCFRN